MAAAGRSFGDGKCHSFVDGSVSERKKKEKKRNKKKWKWN